MTNNENRGEFSLLREMPDVLRARGFRLYLANGKRLVDLWLNGGAAILGHTPPNLLRELKNAASRGIYAPFPHFTEGRYIKALSKLLPGFTFRLYAAPPPELTALFNSGAAKLWRPFSDISSPFAVEKDASLLIPVLPGIQTWRGGLPLGLCVIAANSAQSSNSETLVQMPPSDALSPILLAMAVRGVYDLLAATERTKPDLPRTFNALKKSGSMWQSNGIYLTLKEKPLNEKWETLFHKFFEAGFLLPPTPSQPLILPGELSAGEDTQLAAVLEKS
ncbi:MAG: hypothetical protein LBI28_05020 [Treponema sp.]|nr:hypothetical protein [Treponema sp.]